MINQLFNKFNNLFVFDPNKKGRKLLTLWKIPTHALKRVLNDTKKRHWTFPPNTNSVTPAPKSRDCPEKLGGGTLAALGEDRVSGSGGCSCQSSPAELTMLTEGSWLKCLHCHQSLAAKWRPQESQNANAIDFSLEDFLNFTPQCEANKGIDFPSQADWRGTVYSLEETGERDKKFVGNEICFDNCLQRNPNCGGGGTWQTGTRKGVNQQPWGKD